jgi:hypothetical protein
LEWADYLNSGVVEEESSMIMLDAHSFFTEVLRTVVLGK